MNLDPENSILDHVTATAHYMEVAKLVLPNDYPNFTHEELMEELHAWDQHAAANCFNLGRIAYLREALFFAMTFLGSANSELQKTLAKDDQLLHEAQADESKKEQ